MNNAPGLAFGKGQVVEALETMGLSPNIRGEALSLGQFAVLSNLLGQNSQ